MKTSNSFGIDGISSKILKLVKVEAAPALSVLINTSLAEGIFPSQFKQAELTPLFKNKGSKEDKSNYRPVSNLSAPGKVLEIVVNIQMTRYCERVGILGKHQHGFRAGRSTTSALISSLVKWQSAKQSGKFTGCLLYDLSAAYDTISPDLLVKKFKLYGFDSVSVNWLQSFTTGRSQAVKVGNSISNFKQLRCGVPQGSPLSCLLFLVYIQDLPNWVEEGNVQGYADDTLHFVSGDTIQDVIAGLEEAAKEIFRYFASNELVANPSKTAFLLFRPSRNVDANVTIVIDGTKIEESVSERVLGIQVQRTLEWDEQVSKVISKMNYGLSTLRQLKGTLRKSALRTMSEGLVMSHLRYGIGVYLAGDILLTDSDKTSENLRRLQIKQNDAMRLVLNKRRKDLTPRETLLQEYKTKSVNQIAAETVVMELRRAFQFKIEAIHGNYKKDRSSRRLGSLRASKNPTSFISKSAKLWNRMSEEFRNLETSTYTATRP